MALVSDRDAVREVVELVSDRCGEGGGGTGE